MHPTPKPRPLLSAGLALSLFFIVTGANWAALDRFGSDLPNWDQWDAEGLNLLAPWFEHDHFVQHLFEPHNEHRVVVTKLQNLALTLLAGQWDARLECVFNAMLQAGIAVAFWLTGRRWLAARWHAPWFVVLAALFALPLAWQNVLGGFHSQQYWLLGLSFAAMAVLPFARSWSTGWWAASFVAAAALLTMGSGFFAAAMVLAVVGFRLLRRNTTLRAAWPTLALTAVLTAVGWFTRVEVSYHESLKAKTAHDFLLSIVHSLQWPAPRAYPWLAAVLWLPWLLVAGRALRVREVVESRRGLTIAALGGWVFVQIAATAYARGVGGDFPASRYMDTLAFGSAVNALALGWLLTPPAAPAHWGRSIARGAFGIAWLGVLAWGLCDLAPRNIGIEMPDVKRFYVKAEAHMRGFLATNDPAQLAFPDIPYPGAGSLIERLAHPSLRALLPASIHPPLPLKPAAGDTGVFRENHASELFLDTAPHAGVSPATGGLASLPTWGSFGPDGAAAKGRWTSAPLTAPLGGWLKFEMAGQPGQPGTSLELHDARTGALLAEVRPSKTPGDSWRAAYVRAPRAPFVVTAVDASAQRWLAFSAPVEMGTLSYAAWRCAKNGLFVAEGAAAAALLLGLAAFRSRRATVQTAG